MELVTGYRGADHVTAEQLGDLQAGFAGYEHCVLPVGRKLEAEVVTANKVRIFDGALLTYGRQCLIEAGAYEDVTIENGSQGLLRNDMIVARYVKNEETGIESVNLAVIKGITGETAKDPVPLNGNIRDGSFENEMPLYRVKLKGLAIEGIDPLFNIMMSAKDLEEGISSLNGSLSNYLYIGRYRTSIAMNADLNTYKTPGAYVASYGSLVNSLKNCPVSGGQFTLDVISDGAYDGRVMQVIHNYNSAVHPVYVRYLTDGTTWQSWCKFQGTVV